MPTSATTTVGSRRRLPKAMCKVPQACHLCPQRIKAGQRMGKDFDTGQWAHLGCLVRKISTSRVASSLRSPAPCG